MLRELTIRELTDTEMERVGGGTEGDEIVVTGTRRSGWNGYIPPNPYGGGNSSQYHESYQPTGGGGGGTSTPAPAPEPEPEPHPVCPTNLHNRQVGLDMMIGNSLSSPTTAPVPGANLGVVSFIGGGIAAGIAHIYVVARNCE